MQPPLEILIKPLPLTKEEWIIVKSHSQIGHDLVKPIQFPLPVAQFILEHHEKLDGSGYPFGKTDKELLMHVSGFLKKMALSLDLLPEKIKFALTTSSTILVCVNLEPSTQACLTYNLYINRRI